jgi:purine-binding chemotaxis protein CheW
MTREALAPRLGPNGLPPGAANLDDAVQPTWLLCRAGTMLCALPIEQVIEIMRVLPLEPIAGAPDYVRGLSIIRGAPVPVVDVGLIVGGEVTRSSRLVAVRVATRTVALAVDTVLGISQIAADVLDAMPPLLQEAAADTIAAIGARDADFIVVLRSGRLIPEDVFALLDAEGVTP